MLNGGSDYCGNCFYNVAVQQMGDIRDISAVIAKIGCDPQKTVNN